MNNKNRAKPCTKSKTRVCAWNIRRGFDSKHKEIQNFLENEQIHIAALLEIDLRNVCEKNPPAMEGFSTLLPLALNKVRLAVFVKTELMSKLKIRRDLMTTEIPTIWLELTGHRKVMICAVYREWSPKDGSSAAASEAMDSLCSQIRKAATLSKNIIVMGDINLCSEKWNSSTYQHRGLSVKFRECLSEAGFTQIEVGMTYYSDHRSVNGSYASSALDQVHVSDTGLVENCRAIKNGMSDHLPVVVEVKVKQSHNTKRPERLVRSFKQYSPQKFRSVLASMPWESLATLSNVDEQVEEYERLTKLALDACAPKKLIKQRENYKSGLSSETKELIRQRDLLRRKALKSKSCPDQDSLWDEYRSLRNRVVSALRRDDFKHMQAKFNSIKSIADTWAAVNYVTGAQRGKEEMKLEHEGKTLTDHQDIAEALNGFFVEKVNKLKQEIRPSVVGDPFAKLRENQRNGREAKFELCTVSQNEVEKAIRSLKPKTSAGLDEVSNKLLKDGAPVLVIPLTLIINNSIQSGQFPKSWKKAKVSAIHKKGDHDQAKNYRPVSGLPSASKVLEAVVLEQLKVKCESLKIIPNSQHGFRAGMSTLTALAQMHNSWVDSVDRGNYVGVLLFDLSAAFDTLEMPLLLEKLKLYGAGESVIKWLGSFMSEREQLVQVEGTLSKSLNLQYGVPQGSRLSPFLFLLYVADLPLWTGEAQISGYADDTSASVSASNWEDLKKGLQTTCEEVINYMALNGLKANPTKTGLLVMRPKGSSATEEMSIKVSGDKVIKESTSEKILGIQVSNSLTWKEQLAHLHSTLMQRVSIFSRVARRLPRVNLLPVLDGLVTSIIRYCLPLFAMPRTSEEDPLQGEWKSLQTVYNKAVRAVLHVSLKDHRRTTDLFESAGLLSINQLACETIITLVWKTLSGKCQGAQSLLQVRKSNSQIYTRSKEAVFLKENGHTKLTKQTLQNKGAKLWNLNSAKEIRETVDKLKHVPKTTIKEFVKTMPF